MYISGGVELKSKALISFMSALAIFLNLNIVTQAHALTVDNADIGIQLKFPESYIVISKDTVISGHDISNDFKQDAFKYLSDNDAVYIALPDGVNGNLTVRVESDRSSPSFAFMTDDELKKAGDQITEAFKKDSRFEVAYGPFVYSHPQTNFIKVGTINEGVRAMQYLTTYNGKAYTISLYGEVSRTNAGDKFVDNIKFLQEPVNSKSSLWEDILVKAGAGVVMGLIFGLPYLRSKKKKQLDQ
jgi:hypothetical protein